MDIVFYIISGAVVGFIIGLTGIGGGALMTPLLLMFGFPPNIAVGTDLMYASLTKSTGVYAHQLNKTINWQIVKLLALGSLPGCVLTGLVLFWVKPDATGYSILITHALGGMLILTALVILFKETLLRYSSKKRGLNSQITKPTTTVLMGACLGVLVTLSSVGAGAIGTAILMILYPTLVSQRIIGTDLAHAVPLTLLGGIIHLALGNVDFSLLFCLLIGSIPAIKLGVKLSRNVAERHLRQVLALLLLGIGTKYALF